MARYDRKFNGLMIDEAPQMESSTHTVIHKMFTKSCISNQHVFNKYSITYHCFLQRDVKSIKSVQHGKEFGYDNI